MHDQFDQDLLEEQKYIFGSLFLLANKLQVIGDHYLAKEGMTTKQWLLTACILQFNDGPPTIGEVARLMGSSRQNIKQLALKLAEKDFLRIEKDPKDTRAVRLRLTEKSRAFWEKRQTQDDHFIINLFHCLNKMECKTISESFHKLLNAIEALQREVSND